MKRECAPYSTGQKKLSGRNKDEEGEESREENEKEQIGKFIKTQECNVMTKYKLI